MKRNEPQGPPKQNPDEPSRDRSDRDPGGESPGKGGGKHRGYDYDIPKQPEPPPKKK